MRTNSENGEPPVAESDARSGSHPPRERFDSLLTDPRHYRADFRAIRRALREGRLDSLTDAERDALAEKVFAVGNTLASADVNQPYHSTTWRAFFRYVWLCIDMERCNQRAHWQALGLGLPGRPRRRPRLDRASRLDANAYRRELGAEGLLGRVPTITVSCGDSLHEVRLEWVNDRRYRLRLYWLCPACGGKCVHLYRYSPGLGCQRYYRTIG